MDEPMSFRADVQQIRRIVLTAAASRQDVMNVLRRVRRQLRRARSRVEWDLAEPARPFHACCPTNLPRVLLPFRAPADLRWPFPARQRPTRLGLKGRYLLGRWGFQASSFEGFRSANH